MIMASGRAFAHSPVLFQLFTVLVRQVSGTLKK